MAAVPGKTPPSSGMGSYLKQNAKFAYGGGMLGGLLLASDVKNILDSDNKLKALLKTLKDFVLIRVLVGNVFGSIAMGMKNLVKDSGSLDQALKKLGQMQGAARGLAPFVGSLATARKRVAEMYEVSKKGPFRFEDLAEANKSLEIFTRGTFSSVAATKEVGHAALASGNSIQDVARAVGSFYDTMQKGQPVNEVTEQMRQMGVISQANAEHLNKMAAGGEDVTGTMQQLSESLKQTTVSAGGYKTELQGITEAHQKAIETMQEQFAAPFTAESTKNIQNSTAAMKAITPTIAQISKGAANLYGGFSTAVSQIVKFAAESELLRGVVKGVAVAIGVLSAAMLGYGITSAVGLTRVISGLGASFVAMGGMARTATIALRAAGILGVWGLVAASIATAGVAIYNMSKAVKEVKKEYKDWLTAQHEATAALQAQVAAITTLTEKQAALGAAMKRVSDLQKERNTLQDKEKHQAKEWRSPLTQVFFKQKTAKTLGPGASNEEQDAQKHELNVLGRFFYRKMGWWEKEKNIRKELKQVTLEESEAKKQAAEASGKQTVNKALLESEAQRRFEIEEQTKGIEQRDKEAKAGLEVQSKLELQLGMNDKKRADIQQELTDKKAQFNAREDRTPDQKKKHAAKEAAMEDQLAQVAKERQNIQLQAPEFSSVYKEAKAEQLRQARDLYVLEQKKAAQTNLPEEKKLELEQQISRTRSRTSDEAIKQYKEQGSNALANAEIEAETAKKREASRPSALQSQAIRGQRFQIQTDIAGTEAKSRGDLKSRQAFEDLSKFTHHFDELISAGFGKEEATQLAQAQTGADIREEYAGQQPQVGSMTAMGGGGNLPGIDASTEIARRQETLQQKMVDYLAVLAGVEQKPQEKSQAVYGQ
jgi:hypothetical protein